MSDLPFKGVWIPAKVFSNPDISTNAKFLWGIVHILSNERGCFASRSTLGTYLHCTDRNVQMLISELIEAGLITRDDKGVLWDVVTLSLEGEENFTGGVKKTSGEGRKKLHPIDTSDINDKTKTQALELGQAIEALNGDVNKAWGKYLEVRRARRWTTNVGWMLKQVKYLSGFDPKAAIDAVEASTRNEWQSVHVRAATVHYGRVIKPAQSDTDHAQGF